MKKILAIILSLCLMCGATAFATEINQDSASKSAQTILTTEIGETYTITIPATLDIDYGATATNLPLTVSSYRLKADSMLKLRQSWDGKLENSGGTSLAYTLLHNGSEVDSNINPVTFTGNGTVNLTVAITESEWNSAAAGEYTDTVTFTVAIVAK